MSPATAHIPLALSEVLLPSELGSLVEEAARRGVDPGEVIVLALREFVSRLPKSPAPVVAPSVAAAA